MKFHQNCSAIPESETRTQTPAAWSCKTPISFIFKRERSKIKRNKTSNYFCYLPSIIAENYKIKMCHSLLDFDPY
jgi:hypothetical protein